MNALALSDSPSLSFVASKRPDAQEVCQRLQERYGNVPVKDAEILVAIGGDGMMLEALHAVMNYGIPVYGINYGSVGFLMNDPAESDLIGHLRRSEKTSIHPLRATGTDINGQSFSALAINEVSLLRETRQTAKIQISVDGRVRLAELAADGVMVSTPAGSTAYNASAHGPILPLGSRTLALTPISAFRPRRWRGALLSHGSKVRFDVLSPEKRPVSAVADNQEFRDVVSVDIEEAADVSLHMLFDEGRALGERILIEQFQA
ncbi:NAD kinase [Hyphobacterium sp.]|uniref:NAD kinase n=1 Tax=Hyphobacterium sp. TaxID=2004662 RepID=UPI0037479123